jgi:hypothetical protein
LGIHCPEQGGSRSSGENRSGSSVGWAVGQGGSALTHWLALYDGGYQKGVKTEMEEDEIARFWKRNIGKQVELTWVDDHGSLGTDLVTVQDLEPDGKDHYFLIGYTEGEVPLRERTFAVVKVKKHIKLWWGWTW